VRETSPRRGRTLGVALLTLAALTASSASAQFDTGFGKNKVQYRKMDWKIYHSPHFDLYYYTSEEALVEKVVSMAESAYDRLSREFDYQIQKPTPLLFYATHSEFEQNNVDLNFIPEGVGAFATQVRYRMVLPVDVADGELFALVMHELTHIFQYHILFQGSFARGINAPQWVMEGMASYMAKDERPSDKMFLRDAVVNDTVPSILQTGIGGFMAYRFGHAAFDFMESRWGKEGFRDFVYEFRNTLGGRVEKAVQRAFKLDAEEFDTQFRKWLRQQYLPQLIQTGEPSDFGRRFRVAEDREAEVISPAASPSGDLVAAISTLKGSADVVLFDAKKRRPIANLTKGFTNRYQYLISQFITIGPRMGHDLAFSPDGNHVAAFAKREKSRSLVLIDVLRRRVEKVIDLGETDQQHAPAWSADGKQVAFSGNVHGKFDIFVVDLGTRQLTNLTNDEAFDGSPTFSPDGKSVVFSTMVGGEHAQLFRVDLADLSKRYRLTEGNWDDKDAVYSADGKRLYFTSDRRGTDNIYSLELASGEVRQYTNSVTGCFMPTVLRGREGKDKLVYSGFWKGRFDLYSTDLDAPIGEVQATTIATTSATPAALPRYEPDIQVSLDEANKEKYRRSKFFLEDGGAYIGVQSDQTFVSDTYLSFSDYLGNHRLITSFSSISTFSDFDILYLNLAHRTNWSVELFDNRQYFQGIDQATGFFNGTRGRAAFEQTGAVFSIIRPFDFYHRFELGLGAMRRKIDFQQLVFNPVTGEQLYTIAPRTDTFPLVQGALVGDTAIGASWGAIAGRRWRLAASWAPKVQSSGNNDPAQGGTLTANVSLDFRQYLRVSERSNFSLRFYGAAAYGDFPTPFFIGGLDTIRGFDYASLVGDRVFFTNLEYRFPLLDVLATPVLSFRGIRGRVFIDAGGAWFKYGGQSFRFWDGKERRLQDAVSAYGWGFTVRFGGIDLNWDFAKRWDFKSSLSGYSTQFWIGAGF